MKNNSILAVVLHWGDPSVTEKCISSLEKNTGIDILVVNNSGKEISVGHKEIVSKTNLGFAGGMNIGLEHAIANNYQYVLILNNDTTVNSNLVAKLRNELDQHPELAAVAPTIVYESKPEVIWFAGGHLSAFTAKSPHWLEGESVNLLPPKSILQNVNFLTGCCVVFRVDALKEIGLLDKDYFLYYEDDDWSYRAIKSGWELGHLSTPLVKHAISTGSTNKQIRAYYYHRNRILFIRKNLDIYHKPIAYLFATSSLLAHVAARLIRRTKSPVSVSTLLKDIITRKTGKI